MTKPEVLLAPPFVRNGDLSVFWCGELSMSMQTVAAVGPAPTLGLRAWPLLEVGTPVAEIYTIELESFSWVQISGTYISFFFSIWVHKSTITWFKDGTLNAYLECFCFLWWTLMMLCWHPRLSCLLDKLLHLLQLSMLPKPMEPSWRIQKRLPLPLTPEKIRVNFGISRKLKSYFNKECT